jgi:hypothetical protein
MVSIAWALGSRLPAQDPGLIFWSTPNGTVIAREMSDVATPRFRNQKSQSPEVLI